ncbi:MAG: type 2 lanthipeptide synthetase LanM family protein [Minicystis sp.]
MREHARRRLLLRAEPELPQRTTIVVTTSNAAPNALGHDDLVSIVERASSMFERLGDDLVAVDGAESDRARRLSEWKNIVADGDDERFTKRLAWDGLDQAAVWKALGPVRLADRRALPGWSLLLGELAGEADASAGAAASRSFQADLPIQFEHVMAPLVAAASRRLAARAGAAWDIFSDAAKAGMERALLRRLSLWMSETLHISFGLFRSERIASLDLVFMRAAGERTTDVYRAFVDHMLQGGLRALLLEYPVMARLIATGAASWIDASAELVGRFAADREEIARRLAPAAPTPLRVTAIESLLSDSHNGGRSVSILTLQGGTRVVYKPRSVANEAAWFRLLAWLNEHGAPEQMKVIDVITRPDHGWVEVIAAAPMRNQVEAVHYHRRCGMLVALTYVVGANDLHYENLLAVGDQPVVIDLETILCHSPIETVYGAATDDLLKTIFFESPIRTGLLPRWQTGQGIPVDVSGLGAVTVQLSQVPIAQWKDVNTDLMDLAYETVSGKQGPNCPVLDGEGLSPNDYLEEIAAGFTEAYRLLMGERERMLAPGGPLAGLGALRVRFIYRGTASYLMTLKRSRTPHLLRDGVDRSIYLETMVSPMLFAGSRPRGWPLLELERRALDIEDCPYFVAAAGAAEIDDPRGGTIGGILEAACFDQMVARLERLDERDLENQLALVRASFDARDMVSAHAGSGDAQRSPARAEEAAPLGARELVDEAARIGESILERSISVGRAPHWITLRRLVAIEKSQLDPIGADLFEGRSGIALLFAALHRATARPRFGEVARALAKALSVELHAMTPEQPHDTLIHGLTGVVSLAYVFPHLAALLDDPALLVAADRASRFITRDALAADRRYDILSGAAGSLVALLRLARALPDGDAIERAVACGDHLLAQRSEGIGGLRGWKTFEDRAISGFAHGSAGIAYALLRLHAACGEERFRAAAFEAIALENTTFSAEVGNWPDLRWPQPSFAAGWCHGGPGIALARMEALAHGGSPSLARDINAAATLARDFVRDGTDHLCCGNFGRVLLLREIGRRTDRPDRVRAAEALAAGLVDRVRRGGSYRFVREYAGHVSFPGLFQGTAGVAYALLVLSGDSAVPDIIQLT